MWLRCDSPHGHPRPDRGAGLRAARRRGHSMPDEPSGEELLGGSIWCIGIAVPGLEKGQQELGEAFGVRWRPAWARKLTLADAAGPVRWNAMSSSPPAGRSPSRSGRPSPAPPLDMPEAGGCTTSATRPVTSPPRRNGSTRSDIPATPRPAPTPPPNQGPAGTLIELWDLHSGRPSLRGLFPPESEFAGGPLPGSGL